MTPIRLGFRAALLVGAIVTLGLASGGSAEAQPRSWLKPTDSREAPKMNQNQAALAKKIEEQVLEAVTYGGAFECFVQNGGKCRVTELPDITKQPEAEKFAATATACRDTAKAALAAGLASDHRVEFRGPRSATFSGPMALRSVEHACSYYRILADRHLERVKAKDIDWGGDGKMHSAAFEFANFANRVIGWENAVNCFETKSTHSRCERATNMAEAGNVTRWQKEADLCVNEFRKAREAKTPDDYPIGFQNPHPSFVSPETIATLGKYCEATKVKADKLYQQIVAGPQATAEKARADENASKEAEWKAKQYAGTVKAITQHSAKIIDTGLRLAEGDAKLETELLAKIRRAGAAKHELDSAIREWWEDRVSDAFLSHATYCKEQGSHILKDGASPDMAVEVAAKAIDWKSEFKLPFTLGQYVKACEKVVAYGPQLRQKAEASAAKAQAERGKEEADKLAAFLAVLQGDRHRIFKERNLHNGQVFGPGGTRLRTPEDFVKAKAWYGYAIDHQARPVAQWRTEGWQFNGDKLLRNFGDADIGTQIPWSRAMPDPKDGAPGTMGKGGAAPAPQQRGSNDAAPATGLAAAGGTGGGSAGGGGTGGGNSGGSADAGGGNTVGYAAGGSGSGSVFGLLFLALLGAGFLAIYRLLNLRLKAVEDVLDQLPDARRLMARIPAKAQGPILSGKT